MTNIELQIKNIVYEEFSKLIQTIEGDFITNYIKKRYNFLLSQLDKTITANMVFVSSFESKSGFAIETCAKRIARLKFGEENVPTIVNPRNIKHDINPNIINGQIIVTDIDTNNGDLRGKISTFRAINMASGKGKIRVESGINQNSIKTILPLAKEYSTSMYHTKPVDLAFFNGKDWVVLELKAGGDLDSSNAPANVEKLLTIYAGLNVQNSKAYFATLYNKNGEGNTWTGAVKKHMSYPEMFLIGKDFWNIILPGDIRYERFTELYKMALEELDLNSRINTMIKRTVK
ncbi:MAG: TdeIII family type II restriction endonuclease [Parvimonas micra]